MKDNAENVDGDGGGDGDEGLSVFSNRFKEVSSNFDNLSSSHSTSQLNQEDRVDIDQETESSKHVKNKLASAKKASITDNENKSASDEEVIKKNKRKSTPRSRKSVALSDESDLEILDDLPVETTRQRPSRARPTKTYKEMVELSDDSFVEEDANDQESDVSFQDSDF